MDGWLAELDEAKSLRNIEAADCVCCSEEFSVAAATEDDDDDDDDIEGLLLRPDSEANE